MADVPSRQDIPDVPGRGPLAPRLAALSAARELVTERGFSVGVRDIAAAAGIDHAVVIRYFGSKAGLLDAVLATDCGDLLASVSGTTDTGRGLLMVRQARAGRREALLVVRAGLDGRAGRREHPLPVVREWLDLLTTEQGGRRPDDVLLAPGSLVFLAVSLAAGYAVLEPYERVRVDHDVSRREVDAYVGRAVDELLALAGADSVPAHVAESRSESAPAPPAPAPEPSHRPPRGRDEVKEAVLDAAVDLFSQREIGAVSVRTIARRARVNHSLLFRHFGSKEGVLKSAIERAGDEIDRALAAANGTTEDMRDVVRLIRGDSRILVLTAQALLGGYPVEDVQAEFPAARRLVSLLKQEHADPGEVPPEIVVLCVTSLLFGSVLFEPVLRPATGIAADVDLDALVADAAQVIFDLSR